ncbi:MAG: heavy-metal-associated domain-containing protein [Synergistales bacterium]|nr:heavy-metal-associated domain-containing protein [Synergistales bacterium]
MDKYLLRIPDMSCQHCVNRISQALDEAGISKYRVDLESRTVTVETENLNEVLLALDEAGYSASPAES